MSTDKLLTNIDLLSQKAVLIVCSECGSEDVQNKMWVNSNTNVIDGSATLDDDDCYCKDCQAHTKLISQTEWEKLTEGSSTKQSNVEIGCPFDEQL